MTGVYGWFEGYGYSNEHGDSLVQCSRRDCTITAKRALGFGPWELLQEWQYLLEQTETDTQKR